MHIETLVSTAPEKTNRLWESKTLQTDLVVTPTTFLTSTTHKHVDSTSLPPGISDGTAPKGGDQYSLSVAQLAVAVLMLLGVGRLVEHLWKKAWEATVPHFSNPTQTLDRSDDAAQPAAEPRPLVQEHPAGPASGTISEQQQQDFAASAQPVPAVDEQQSRV
ncbi:hypothetical protein V498_01615 [Pseudogymnoascus sp. VKM F-4517 (FW-2822)]|nr:hypothetical protein V498_01615 [Pseudogymnoascus sp. VKM F-4517 (FW-2822)]